ncbi:syntaxin-binding protein 5-like isoform X9, partial [Dinothrombium tinctorium]
ITYCHLPFQSKWLYIGTERGNVHIANVESFMLSGYVINWNKVIELSRKTHPGSIVHLSDCPIDANKLLIGYDSGVIAMWDLRNRTAETRITYTEGLGSISWHNEGRQFLCSHTDGSITTWNLKSTRPASVVYPHAKNVTESLKPEPCKPVFKVEWRTVRNGDSFIIFSGGLPYGSTGSTSSATDTIDTPSSSSTTAIASESKSNKAHSQATQSLTIIHGKTTTVLEMEHDIIDFVTLCETPWESDFNEPYAVVVLLYNDLVVVDLTSAGYPCFQNPYTMDLHESPITYCAYFADCASELIPAFYSVGAKGNPKRTGFSEKEWPINGGEWGTATLSYPEVIVTGHADGTLKFWDASSVNLHMLYKLKTSKLFLKPKTRPTASGSKDELDDDPFAIEQISFCPESRMLCVAGAASHVIVFRFSRQESQSDIAVVEVPMNYEQSDSDKDNCGETEAAQGISGLLGHQGSSDDSGSSLFFQLTVKSGQHKRLAGFQPELVCLSPWIDNSTPPYKITSLTLNSSSNLLAYGNENGLVIIDLIQKSIVVNIATFELYGTADPFQRYLKSPKRSTNPVAKETDGNQSDPDRCKSPISDQVFCRRAIRRAHTHTHTLTQTHHSIKKIDTKESSTPNLKTPENQEACNINDQHCPVPPPRLKRQNKKVLNVEKSDRGENNDSEQQQQQQPQHEKKTQTQADDDEVETGEKNAAAAASVVANDDGIARAERPKELKLSFVNKRMESVESDIVSEISVSEVSANDSEDKQQSSSSNISSPTDTSDAAKNVVSLFKTGSKKQSSKRLKNKVIDLREANKIDSFGPCLWVGTSLGSVIVITISLPDTIDNRILCLQSVLAVPCGNIFRLKGSILCVSFIDNAGTLVTATSDHWKDCRSASMSGNKNEEKRSGPLNITRSSSGGASHFSSYKSKISPTSSSSDIRDFHFAVLVSEKQARVLSLPSQVCKAKATLSETSFTVRADVISMKTPECICLAAYLGTGNVVVYSLPSLKPLIDVDFLPLTDVRIARTITFSANGHGMYLTSPSEIQKFTISTSVTESIPDMIGNLFIQKEIPEAPKLSFFKGLFSGGPSLLDREELFGESASGKGLKATARVIPGSQGALDQAKSQTTSLAGELSRVRQGFTERGENLERLEEKTARMMAESEGFRDTAHQLLNRYKDKKWYQF